MDADEAVRARIPADVDTPDRILLGLATRQAAILAAAAVPAYLAWRSLDGLVPPELLLAALTPFGVIATVVALGRRDGLSLDRWFTAALSFLRAPRRLAPVRTSSPGWAPPTGHRSRARRGHATAASLASLRLPARVVTVDGIVETGDRSLALVAASTVNIDLRTAAEQAAVIGGFARWLNALTGAVQIVVSAQRVDLAAHAVRLAEQARSATDPWQRADDGLDVLTQAAVRHADWLLDLAQESDPLARTVTVVHTASGPGAGREAARRAARTASALTTLGASTVVLDGTTVTATLTAATDRFQPTDPTWPRTPPSGVVTGAGLPGLLDVSDLPSEVSNGLANPLGNPSTLEHGPDRVDGEAAAVVGPSAVEVTPSCLRVGDGWAATVAVTGYPAEVGPAWLEPVLSWPGRLDAAIHIEPIPSATAAGQLRRQRARLESTRRLDADKGRLGDPVIDAAADDAADLADRIARGDARLFRVGIYLTVHAPTRAGVLEAVADVRALAASVLLDTQPVTWRQLQGWTSTLPMGTDSVRMTRVFDTAALAMAFPLASSDLPAPLPGQPAAAGGVLYGVNAASQGVVWWNRWDTSVCDNHNSVVLARSGAGKSYLVKLEVLRSLYDGVHAAIIDPEDEYLRLAEAVGGTSVRLGAPGVRLNPLDLAAGDTRPDTLTRRILFLHTLVSVLLGHQPPPSERAALDKAIIAAYAAAGITNDPATWTRPAPLLRDVVDALAAAAGGGGAQDPAEHLAARLWPWTQGSFRDLFDGPTTHRPQGRLVVWSTRHLPEELRAAGMLLALDAIWRDVDTPTQPSVPYGDGGPRRLVVVDEAWTLLRDGEGARFLYKLAKAARKRRAGLTVVTQDAPDLLGSDLGQAVISNAATQVLLRQAPQAIDLITDTFHITGGEARLLVTAGRGQALLLSGQHRVTFQVIADPAEHDLATTGITDDADPA